MERTARSPIRSLSSADLIIHQSPNPFPSPRFQRVYCIEHTHTHSGEALSSHVERIKSYRQSNRYSGDSGGTSTLKQFPSRPHIASLCAPTREKSHSGTTPPSACLWQRHRNVQGETEGNSNRSRFHRHLLSKKSGNIPGLCIRPLSVPLRWESTVVLSSSLSYTLEHDLVVFFLIWPLDC